MIVTLHCKLAKIEFLAKKRNFDHNSDQKYKIWPNIKKIGQK